MTFNMQESFLLAICR